MQKASLPKGTRDFSPETMVKRKHIISTIEKVYQSYGFAPLETPAMENLSTLTGKYGEEGDTLLFKILNSGDFLSKTNANDLAEKQSNKVLPTIADKGLRYDLTVPFARYVVQHQTEISFPFKRYQIQPVWRADRPQKGRYREFWQCDADVIGTDSLLCEADFIAIYQKVFQQLGLTSFQVHVNHRKILEAVAKTCNFQGSFSELTIVIDKLDKIGWDAVGKELISKGLPENELDTLKQLLIIKPFTEDSVNLMETILSDSTEKEIGIQELRKILSFCGVNTQGVYLNLSLARGLDYYTGCIFEASIENSGIGSVSGGGRYDNLTGIFGLNDVSGVGISFGIDRLYDVMSQENLFDDTIQNNSILFCHFDEKAMEYCIPIAAQLRDSGLSAVVYPDSKKIRKQFDYANKLNFTWVCVVGDNEIKEGILQLKNMVTGEQESITPTELISRLS